MRTLISISLFLALGLGCRALTIINGPVAHSPYLFIDNVEYASAGGATSVGWTDASGTWGVAGLEGSYAVKLDTSGNIATTPNFNTSGETWITLMVKPVTTANDMTFISFAGVSCIIRSDGSLRITSGTFTSGTGSALVDGTAYYCKIRYVPAASGSTRVEMRMYDSGGTQIAQATKTDCTATANISALQFKGATGSPVVIDRIRVMTTDLGHAPSP